MPGKSGGAGRRAPTLKILYRGKEIRPSPHEAKIINDMLKRHPTKVVAKVNRIVVCGTYEDWEREYNKTFNGEGDPSTCGGFYTRFDKAIYMPPSSSVACFDHEIGHIAYWAAWDFNVEGEWDSNFRFDPNFDRHTAYSNNGLREGFAESYAAWIQTGGKVARLSELPSDYAYGLQHIGETFDVIQRIVDKIP